MTDKMDLGEAGLANTIEKFVDMIEDVPHGNSDWQNRHAIVNCELTPGRAYRHASLRIMNRLQALNASYFDLRKEEVEIKMLERKLAAEKDELERELLQIEIARRASLRPYTVKLIKDAIREIESLSPVIESMGKLSRADFEAGEAEHFRLALHNQAKGKTDVLVGLEAMGVDLKTEELIADFKPLFAKIANKQIDDK